jgi:hypothetical protein
MSFKKLLLIYILIVSVLNSSEVRPFSFFDIELGAPLKEKWKVNFKSYDISHFQIVDKQYQKSTTEKPIEAYHNYTIYTCTYDSWKNHPNFIRPTNIHHTCIEKNIYAKYNPKMDNLPYQEIMLDTTPINDVVYNIRINFKADIFNTFDECESYIKNIIENLKEKKKNLKYDWRNMEDSKAKRMLHYLKNGTHQTMFLECTGFYKQKRKEGFFDFLKEKKIDYVTARISYWDKRIEQKVKEDYKRREEEKERAKIQKKKNEEDLKRINRIKSIDLFY